MKATAPEPAAVKRSPAAPETTAVKSAAAEASTAATKPAASAATTKATTAAAMTAVPDFGGYIFRCKLSRRRRAWTSQRKRLGAVL